MRPAIRPALVSLLLLSAAPCLRAADSDTPADNEELTRLYTEDQSDRKPPPGSSIDWSVVGPRDKARLARIKHLYAAGELKTGADYYHAAMVLQHGEGTEDYLLAHELCVVALSKGHSRALWLAAATEDRFLRSLGRPQRFGTQYRSEGGGPTRLQETDPSVTDQHRREMKVPPLETARANAARFDTGPSFALPPLPDAPALTQDIFAPTDDAGTALEKLRKFIPKSAEEAFTLAKASRDLCARFPAPHVRAAALAHVALHWSRLSETHLAALKGWSPVLGETDPDFTPEQRATIAERLVYVRAIARTKADPSLAYDDAMLAETASVLTAHRSSLQARAQFINAALCVAPDKAIPRLRELLPDDPKAEEAIAQLERIGRPLDLTLTTLEGAPLHLRDLRGKVVVLHFFNARFGATPNAIARLEEFAADNVALVGICLEKNLAAARDVVAKQGITWPVALNDTGAGKGIAIQFRAEITPYYLLVDRAGNLRYRGIQIIDPTALKRLEALVAEK